MRDAVRDFLPEVRKTPITSDWTCRECDLRVLCGNCAGWAYVEMGDPEAPDSFRCHLTELRHREFGLTVRVVDEVVTGKELIGEA
jgi:hypothetical protein